jgi:excinuclease UvrABC ATPase subunit
VSKLELRGLRAGNLRNLDLEIPHGQWTAVHGPSGAGKSALLFRSIEPVARQRFRLLEDPHALPGREEQWLPHVADQMLGLQPVLAAAGEIPRGRRLTEVGTALDLWPSLVRVFQQHGERRCPQCSHQWKPLRVDDLIAPVQQAADGTAVYLYSAADGHSSQDLLRAGWTRVLIEDDLTRLEDAAETLPSASWLLLDRLKWRPTLGARIHEAAQEAVRRQSQVLMQIGERQLSFASANQCPQCQHALPAREEAELLHLREADDLVLKDQSWSQWCRLPLEQWLQLPGDVGYRSRRRLEYLARTRLGHLAATRTLGTLSLGEGRRLELVALLSQVRCGQLALFDEPGMGLHGSERRALAGLLRELVEQGNTVLTADPAREFLEAADRWLLLGPGGGEEGGTVVGQGERSALPAEQTAIRSRDGNSSSGALHFKKLRHRFLDIPKLSMPLGQVVSVVGVSGSGKSTLLEAELVPRLREERDFDGKLPEGGVAVLLERALGSSAFSTVATLSGGWKGIRDAFAGGEEARIRGLSASDLIARVGKGACPLCKGHGLTQDRLPCADCESLGLREDLLELRLRNRSLRQWLTTPLSKLEKRLPSEGRLRTLVRHLTTLGLGNRTFGERGVHLSLGERGRIALAKALASSRRDRPKLFLLDEPCLGLPFREAHRVVDLLHQLCAEGHSFWVVEHHEVMLRSADHVIEIGPGAGPQGGQLLFEGPPENLDQAPTPTGQWLASRAVESEIPPPPPPLTPPISAALTDSWQREGRRALEQDLLRELSTRSPLLADMPGMQEDLLGEAAALPPTAWPAAAPGDADLWQVLGIETIARRSLERDGAVGCSNCGGPGPWRDVATALLTGDEKTPPPTGEMDFSGPLNLPAGSAGSESALLQAAGFRAVVRDGERIRLTAKIPYQAGDEVWLDRFDPVGEERSGRLQDLQHHADLLSDGHLLGRRHGEVVWQYHHQACRHCGVRNAGSSFQLAGRTWQELGQMPLGEALQHFAQHSVDDLYPRAQELLGGGSLLHHTGMGRASAMTACEQRAARLCGWMLFPLPGVVLLHDQPLSCLPKSWAQPLAAAMLDGEHGVHRFTDPEAHHLSTAAAGANAPVLSQPNPWRIEPLSMEFEADAWADPLPAPKDHSLRRALGLRGALQQHFARTEEARLRGLQSGDFQRKRKDAACATCKGSTGIRIHPHLRARCTDCAGSGWARELQAVEDRGLRWTSLGQATLVELHQHFAATPGIARVLGLAVKVGMGEVVLDTPLSRLPRGCRRLAPILRAMADGKEWAAMNWAAPAEGLNLLEVEQLLFTMVDFASNQIAPNWRENHPVLAPQP